jgi:hypothetical protein
MGAAAMTDQITLTMPRERAFFGVARLVLAGLATRLDVTVDHLEDLELALDALLERRGGPPEVTVTLGVEGDELQGEPPETLSLRRLLDAVVDRYEVVDRDGGAWVDLSKRFAQS